MDVNESKLLDDDEQTIRTSNSDYRVIINPGIDHIIESDDICLYISRFKEEIYDWKFARHSYGKFKHLLVNLKTKLKHIILFKP